MLIRLVDFLETYFEKNSPLFLGVRLRGPVVSILTLTNYSYLPWVRGLVVNPSERPLPLSEAQSRP